LKDNRINRDSIDLIQPPPACVHLSKSCMSSQGFQFRCHLKHGEPLAELAYFSGVGAFTLTQQETSGESDAPNQDRQTDSHLPAAVAADHHE